MINDLLNIIDGKQTKLTIKAFEDEKREKPIPDAEFKVMFNPAQYTKSYATDYIERKTADGRQTGSNIKNANANTFNFDFLIDGTGASGEKVEVSKKVNEFLQVAYNYSGKSGKKYLKLIWVDEIAKCVLTNVDINYTMFRPNGSPLRATIKATFKEGIKHMSTDWSGNRSDNMDIMKIIKEGESLIALARTIDGNSDRLVDIAVNNGLDNLRLVPPGSKILFPAFK